MAKAKKENVIEKDVSLKEMAKGYESLVNSKEFQDALHEVKLAINNGENILRQTRQIEVSVFDDAFLSEMEEGVDAIAKIVSNPRTFIRDEEELVEAGLAQKITTLSIQHFASHTQFIRNIDDDGNVIPEKILTIFSETDTAIYENRFIMTLIRRTMAFIKSRYEFIKEHIHTYDSDLLQVMNRTQIGANTYEIYSRIKVSTPTSSALESKRNNDILARLDELKTKVGYFLHSRFMTEMKNAKEVSNPIHQTNMIRKHPDYHRAYLLWCFIDKYEELGISFDSRQYDQKFSKEYRDLLSSHLAESLLLMRNNQIDIDVRPLSREKKFTPTVIFDLEDETYKDGKYLYDAYPDAYKKPYEFVPLPEEIRLENEELAKKLEAQRRAKAKVDELILEDKDKMVYEAAKKKDQREKYLLSIIDALQKENEELKKKLTKHEKVDL